MDTLAFGYILPTTGRIPDFHRLETCAAGRTKNLSFLYDQNITGRRGFFAFLETVLSLW